MLRLTAYADNGINLLHSKFGRNSSFPHRETGCLSQDTEFASCTHWHACMNNHFRQQCRPPSPPPHVVFIFWKKNPNRRRWSSRIFGGAQICDRKIHAKTCPKETQGERILFETVKTKLNEVQLTVRLFFLKKQNNTLPGCFSCTVKTNQDALHKTLASGHFWVVFSRRCTCWLFHFGRKTYMQGDTAVNGCLRQKQEWPMHVWECRVLSFQSKRCMTNRSLVFTQLVYLPWIDCAFLGSNIFWVPTTIPYVLRRTFLSHRNKHQN